MRLCGFFQDLKYLDAKTCQVPSPPSPGNSSPIDLMFPGLLLVNFPWASADKNSHLIADRCLALLHEPRQWLTELAGGGNLEPVPGKQARTQMGPSDGKGDRGTRTQPLIYFLFRLVFSFRTEITFLIVLFYFEIEVQ